MAVGPLGAAAPATEDVGRCIRPWVEVCVPEPQNGPYHGLFFPGAWSDSPTMNVLLVPSLIRAMSTERSLKSTPWSVGLGAPAPVPPGQLYSVYAAALTR